MKTIFIITGIILLLILSSSCEEESARAPFVFVGLYARIENSTVSSANLKSNSNHTLTAPYDSLHVDSIKILANHLQFHIDNKYDELYTLDTFIFKFGYSSPFIINFNNFTNLFDDPNNIGGLLLIGILDNVYFEHYRISTDEINLYKNDTKLSDFTTLDRYTTIIEGTIFKGNDTTHFIYRSTANANIKINIQTDYPISDRINLEPYEHYYGFFTINAKGIFINNGILLDPLDENNRAFIDSKLNQYKFDINKSMDW
ncbi:MAG: hypothetical protein ABSG15_12675 [FCB group bacterium]